MGNLRCNQTVVSNYRIELGGFELMVNDVVLNNSSSLMVHGFKWQYRDFDK